jgi:hypothetical protein
MQNRSFLKRSHERKKNIKHKHNQESKKKENKKNIIRNKNYNNKRKTLGLTQKNEENF